MYVYRIEADGTDTDITQTYYVNIREDATGLYYDADSDTFVAWAAAVDPNLPMTEIVGQPGCWELTLPLNSGDTGAYSLLPRDGLTDRLLPSQARRVYLTDGTSLVDEARSQVLISHHYSGIDALRLLNEDGEPVDGAVIRVFRKADFDADDFSQPAGVTTTREDGRWTTPVPVNTGITYTILYHKAYSVGPTAIEVTVP